MVKGFEMLCDNGHMPKLTMPSWSEDSETAIDLLGNRGRLEILHFLLQHGTANVGTIVDAVPAHRQSFWRNLGKLELHNLVSSDVPSGDRHGRQPLWTATEQGIAAAFVFYI